jgi:hypothetical protein
MTNFPSDDDRNLVKFLRQNSPAPPPVNPHLERHLMEMVQQQPPFSKFKPHPLLLAIPSVVTAGFFLIGSSDRWLNYQSEVVVNSDILETFLVNSWDSTFDETNFMVTDEDASHLILSTPQQPKLVSAHR